MKRLQDRMAHIYKTHKPQLEGKDGQISIVEVTKADKSMVNQWFNGGIKSIGLEHALRIEAAFGYSHIWLMKGIGDPIATPGQVVFLEAEPPEPMLTLVTPEAMALLDLYWRATDEGQFQIIEAAEIAEKKPAVKIGRGKAK